MNNGRAEFEKAFPVPEGLHWNHKYVVDKKWFTYSGFMEKIETERRGIY